MACRHLICVPEHFHEVCSLRGLAAASATILGSSCAIERSVLAFVATPRIVTRTAFLLARMVIAARVLDETLDIHNATADGGWSAAPDTTYRGTC